MPIIRHLIIDAFGAHLGKYSQRLKVTCKGETLAQAPLLHLQSVTIAGRGVSLSAEAVRECCERGIPIHFIGHRGDAYASLYSAGLTGTVATRRAQFAAYAQPVGLQLVLAWTTAKLHNQSNLLKYVAKYRKETAPDLYETLRLHAAEILDGLIEIDQFTAAAPDAQESPTVDDLRARLMGLEGAAARRYWEAIRRVVPEKYAFPGRKGRGAEDPLNSALNYGYGILYGQVERCLVLAGLDPYAGFLHVDRPGKPSLTLDFIEEFRQPVVDRTVIGLANKNVAIEQDDHQRLTQETRRMLADKVLARLDGEVGYEGKNHSLRAVMQAQARHAAAFLRAERPAYTPFVMTW